MHPCKVQIRNFDENSIELVKKLANKFSTEIEVVKKGLDVYFEDVNDARFFISKLRKLMEFEIKMSTEYAGLRKGRVRVLFVYSLRRKKK